MAKSTKAQQVSTGTSDSYTDDELNDPAPPIHITRAMLGAPPKEDTPSVGMDSSPSSESANTKSDNENPSRQPLAPMTENPFGQQDKETDSTAALTVGVGQTETEPQPSDEDEDDDEFEDDDEDAQQSPEPVTKKAAKKAASKKARVRSTGDDDFSLLQ